jgi:hypothetical protein
MSLSDRGRKGPSVAAAEGVVTGVDRTTITDRVAELLGEQPWAS